MQFSGDTVSGTVRDVWRWLDRRHLCRAQARGWPCAALAAASASGLNGTQAGAVYSGPAGARLLARLPLREQLL